MHNFDQLFGRLRARIITRCLGVDEVLKYVVLDHLGDETVKRAPTCRGLLQNCGAGCIFLNPPFDGIELPADAPEAEKQFLLLLFLAGVGHFLGNPILQGRINHAMSLVELVLGTAGAWPKPRSGSRRARSNCVRAVRKASAEARTASPASPHSALKNAATTAF
jgi:hypothetical protein